MPSDIRLAQEHLEDVMGRYVCAVCKRRLEFDPHVRDLDSYLEIVQQNDWMLDRSLECARALCCGKIYRLNLTIAYQ